MSQKSFELQPAASYAAEDWITTESNVEAHTVIMGSPEALPSPLLCVYGAQGVGKTHLAHLWGAHYDAQFIDAATLMQRDSVEALGDGVHHVLEDVHQLDSEAQQTALFHLLNEVRQRGDRLLITAHYHPTKLAIMLPDLASRLAGFTSVGLHAPDDMLLEALIMKQFSDKQLKISADVLHYIVSRCARSCAEVKRLVERIDAASLQQKRNITVPFVRDIMQLAQAQ